MGRSDLLDTRIFEWLKKRLNGKVSESTIRPAISRIRRRNPSLTLNAAAEVFATRHNESVQKFFNERDREAFKTIRIEKVSIIPSTRGRRREIVEIAKYDTSDRMLKAHLDEINKTYSHGCYTATFILCRKVLENLVIHHVLRKKYSTKSKQDREKYFDFDRNRFLDFSTLLSNLRDSSIDFSSEKSLVERICDLAGGFKETANEMTHSLYHIARKNEIDEKGFQQILDLIAELEKSIIS
jgi:hypothetical protein